MFRRPERGHWFHEAAGAGESIEILGRALVVDDIYARVSPPPG
ncbi:MAG TPA: hypothetical protein VM925_02935 [Labilithrix sp.]|nr:hypothetical protein [Labilithrix sp.]